MELWSVLFVSATCDIGHIVTSYSTAMTMLGILDLESLAQKVTQRPVSQAPLILKFTIQGFCQGIILNMLTFRVHPWTHGAPRPDL